MLLPFSSNFESFLWAYKFIRKTFHFTNKTLTKMPMYRETAFWWMSYYLCSIQVACLFALSLCVSLSLLLNFWHSLLSLGWLLVFSWLMGNFAYNIYHSEIIFRKNAHAINRLLKFQYYSYIFHSVTKSTK